MKDTCMNDEMLFCYQKKVRNIDFQYIENKKNQGVSQVCLEWDQNKTVKAVEI